MIDTLAVVPTPQDTQRSALTEREADYLARLALNHTRKRVAADDGVSVRYVSAVVDKACRKLGAESLIDAFRALGWLKPGGTW